MIVFLMKRVAWAIGVVLVLTFITYLIFFPGLRAAGLDPARLATTKSSTPQTVANARKFLGLDHPWTYQYETFLLRIVRGPSRLEKEVSSGQADRLGFSFRDRLGVGHLVVSRFAVTLGLVLGAAVLWLGFAVFFGVAAALRPRGWIDRVCSVFTGALAGVPVYLIGFTLLYLVAYVPTTGSFLGLHFGSFTLLPLVGYSSLRLSDPWPWAQHLILPWVALALAMVTLYFRLMRAEMLSALDQDYVRTARAKGLDERQIALRHALRNALPPVATLFGLDFGILLGGVVLVETVFGIPGLGNLAVTSVLNLDVPTATGVIFFAGVLVVVVNLAVDVLQALLDPRVRYA
jgi:peptide/nickel transport system permease protein